MKVGDSGPSWGPLSDSNSYTRWSSKSSDSQCIYIDLGKPSRINGVGLNWETAYGKAFRIQVSDDTRDWKDVYATTHGHEERQHIDFEDTTARYVRLLGTERGSGWGYSLWDFDVFGTDDAASGLSDVYFIRLTLKDKNGIPVGENFYWRGNRRKDFTALNSLPKAALKVTSSVTRRDGKCFMTVTVSNPLSSPATAFAVKIQAVKSSGEQILRAFMDADYFTLLRGESKVIHIEFPEALAGGETPGVRVTP